MHTKPLAAALAACALALPAAAEGPSAEKLALIRELLAISGGEKVAEQVVERTLAELRVAYASLVEEVLRSETELDEEQKQALREHFGDYERFAASFRALFAERVRLDEILEEAYVPLYDASFSERELREIVAFYRTPTGARVLETMPGLLQEGTARTLAAVQPRVLELVGEVLARQRQELLR